MSPLAAPPREVPVNDSVDDLAPRFLEKVMLVVHDMRAWNYTPRIFETMRTSARQAYLFGFGRSYDDGRGKVTQSRTEADTWHGYGLAVDIICERKLWDPPRDFWEVLGVSARRHGLLWGADWNSDWSSSDERFLDRPHVQWGAPMRRSPSDRAAMLRADKGLEAVWREVGAL